MLQKRLSKVLQEHELSEEARENLSILRNALNITRDHLETVHHDLENDESLKEVVLRVYENPGTDMGDYWVTFMEMSDVLLQNVHACHTCNIQEYLSSSNDMVPGIKAYNNHHYSRLLPDFLAMISSLPQQQFEFFKHHFAQSMTGLPFSSMPMDLWIETTMNLNSKLKQGKAGCNSYTMTNNSILQFEIQIMWQG